jgi:hypothetical protein
VSAFGEHDFEPAPGLPELLPAGEHILWQGAPDWASLARRAFHARTLTIYFAVILMWRAATVLSETGSVSQALIAMAWLLPFAGSAVGLLVLIAWLTSRTTLYTITNKRVVMRIGIVLTVTFNIPFRNIESAGLKIYSDRTGDIPLALSADSKIAFVHLWPHARPWRAARPEPMLRDVPDAARVAAIVSQALATAARIPARAIASEPEASSAPAASPAFEPAIN